MLGRSQVLPHVLLARRARQRNEALPQREAEGQLRRRVVVRLREALHGHVPQRLPVRRQQGVGLGDGLTVFMDATKAARDRQKLKKSSLQKLCSERQWINQKTN